MEGKELRIGNCIDFNGMLCIIEEIDGQGVVVDIAETQENEWIDLFQFTPIHLTEEWLLRLGGEKVPHFTVSNSIIIKTKRNQQLSFGCVGTPNFMVFLQELDPDNEDKITDSIPIHNWDYDKDMYVHQLQNLFFALTGEELTIK